MAAIAIVAVWCLIAGCLLLRLVMALLALERLKRDLLPLPVEHRELLAHWKTRVPALRDVRLCVCPTTPVPVALGLGDAAIVLPSRLVTALVPEELDGVILHELAHLQRADDWTNALQRVVSALLFFHPAVRWLGRRLDVEREVACDRLVVAYASDANRYARCLAKIAEITAWPHTPLPAPGVFTTRKTISIRIERLLKSRPFGAMRISYGAVAGIAAAMCVVLIACNIIAPVFISASARAAVVPTAVPTAVLSQPRHRSEVAAHPVAVSRHRVAIQTLASATPIVRTSSVAANDGLPARPPVAVAVTPRPRVAQRTVPKTSRAVTGPVVAPTLVATANTTRRGSASPSALPPSQGHENGFDLLDALQAYGYRDLSADDLINLRDHGVSPALLQAVRRYGLRGLTPNDLIALADHGVDASYIDGLTANGFAGLSVASLVTLRDRGVDPAYVGGLRERGLAVSPDQAISLRDHGVSLSYIDRLRHAWGRSLSIDEIIRLRDSGVYPQ